MTWGSAANIFNANNVLFKMGRIPSSPDAVEEIILVHSFKVVKDIPVARTISRDGPVEVPNPVLREFLINADVTEDLYDKLEAVSDPTTRGGFNIEDFEMEANSILPGGSVDITLNFDGFVRHFEGNAIEDTKFNIDIIIRAINNTVVVS